MKRSIIAKALCLLLVIPLLVSCSQKIPASQIEQATIQEFHYSFGSYFGGYWDYTIVNADGKTVLTASGSNGVDLSVDSKIPSEALDDIKTILAQQDIGAWNGFSERDDGVMDGYSFSLSVLFSDGKTLKADGYMKYPANYEAGSKVLAEYLETLSAPYNAQ
ncbi:MAG: hypothetical protein VB081_05300 [Christensenella sp.]|uniref:hypothetical protein n=1 Tax=Christensenella sp. TaxID=1935934 RepID=UPI002B2044FF|nr:hypothetical protein [Christensenella sp.]MEA5002895.1 hypothetical protein [Christensenella sp.]